MNSSSKSDCHLCKSKNSVLLNSKFAELTRITSDCRQWTNDGRLGECNQCGSVVKPITRGWRAEVKNIYDEYQIYHQGAGEEPAVFVGGFEEQFKRSEALFGMCIPFFPAIKNGKLLDIGSGNGAVLRAMGPLLEDWKMFGHDITDRYRTTVESIHGVAGFFVGELKEISLSFDIITLAHVLEHVPDPLAFLSTTLKLLNEGGLLIIQVPDSETNFFDLVVADHCSHYTSVTLCELVKATGIEVAAVETGWMERQLLLLAYKRGKPKSTMHPNKISKLKNVATDGVDWLIKVRDHARDECAKSKNFGIFGSANNAVWLASELSDQVSFFVDEDHSRVGQKLLGRPIILPDQVTEESSVYIAMPMGAAQKIMHRLFSKPGFYILPPA